MTCVVETHSTVAIARTIRVHISLVSAFIGGSGVVAPMPVIRDTLRTYAYRREDGVYVVPIGCLKD